MQQALLIYLQTAVLTLAMVYNGILAYEASPRTWKHAINIAIFATLLCAEICQWPIWH